MAKVRLAVVDDHSPVREGVISILQRQPGIEIIGEGASAEDAVRIATTAAIDVMLLDVRTPGGGIATLQKMAAASAFPKTVMLIVSEAGEDGHGATQADAQGIARKGLQKSALVRVAQSVRAGAMPVDVPRTDGGTGGTGAPSQAEPVRPAEPEPLTPRESEVLELVSRGMTNKEVARRLYLTDRTIKNYMTSIMSKLRVRNRVEAALSVERGRK